MARRAGSKISRQMLRESFLLLLVLLFSGAVLGAGGPEFPVSPTEAEAAKLLDEGRFTLAKEKARAILAVDKGSFVANFVLGSSYAKSDGNLPKARFFLVRARADLEREWPPPMPPDGPWRWHARTLWGLILVAGEMDDRQEQIRLLEEHDRLYTPKAYADFGWPLMKLGRMEEGRRKLEQALESGNQDARLTALNTLGAIENETGHREAAYGVFKKLVQEVQEKGLGPDPVFTRNWANCALGLLRYDEAERLFLQSASQFQAGTFTNPWKDLAELYLAEGRFPEALGAVREMQVWAHRTLPALDQQSWAGRQMVVAVLLAESGFVEEAAVLARQVQDRPDRKGGSSGQQGQDEAGNLIQIQLILRLQGERLAEEASWCSVREWPRLAWDRAKTAAQAWSARERAASITISNGWLRESLRPFSYNSVELMEWAKPELVEVAGAGIVGEEARGLLRSSYPDKGREEPFLRLLLGESLLLRGSAAAKGELDAALAALPKSEVLLCARAEALLGKACEEARDFPAALRHYQEALLKHPGVMRTLGFAIPVRIEASGGAAAGKAAKYLRASPRFEDRGAGFILAIHETPAGLTATLSSPDGSLLARASAPPAQDPPAAARMLCKEIHRRVFAARVDLAQTDIVSLQGSNLTGETTREQLKGLFGAPEKKPEP